MNIWKTSTFVLGAAFLGTLIYATATTANAEPQPHMNAALAHLEGAKKQLETATHDKGGHRVKAIAATNEAIEQTKKGIAFDDKH